MFDDTRLYSCSRAMVQGHRCISCADLSWYTLIDTTLLHAMTPKVCCVYDFTCTCIICGLVMTQSARRFWLADFSAGVDGRFPRCASFFCGKVFTSDDIGAVFVACNLLYLHRQAVRRRKGTLAFMLFFIITAAVLIWRGNCAPAYRNCHLNAAMLMTP